MSLLHISSMGYWDKDFIPPCRDQVKRFFSFFSLRGGIRWNFRWEEFENIGTMYHKLWKFKTIKVRKLYQFMWYSWLTAPQTNLQLTYSCGAFGIDKSNFKTILRLPWPCKKVILLIYSCIWVMSRIHGYIQDRNKCIEILQDWNGFSKFKFKYFPWFMWETFWHRYPV